MAHRSRLTPTNFALTLALCALMTGCVQGAAYQVAFEDDPAGSSATVTDKGSVVMVLSAASVQTLADGSTRETGYFLNEFYHPYQALLDAGYDVQLASAGGRAPSLDPESLDEKYWDDVDELERARDLIRSHPQMRAPLHLEDVAARHQEFQALVVPGGQGVMVDLLDDPTLHELIAAFADDHRPVGLICHAPVILSRMLELPASFADRHVTSVSGFEEWYIETLVMGAKAQVRGIGARLDEAGLRHASGRAGRSNAVRDCNLVTSQNPFSGEAFNALFIAALEDWRLGGRCIERGREGA